MEYCQHLPPNPCSVGNNKVPNRDEVKSRGRSSRMGIIKITRLKFLIKKKKKGGEWCWEASNATETWDLEP